MTSRFIAVVACGLGLAVACGSNDEDKLPPAPDTAGSPADAGAPASGAGTGTTPGGSVGSGGGGAPGGAGGAVSLAGGGAAGDGGGAGQPGQAGAPSGPGEPGASACGAHKYDTGEGCDDCPALPTPPVAMTLGCDNVSRAYNENDEYLELSLAEVSLHEPLGGTLSLSWLDLVGETPPGTAEVTWTYTPSTGQFRILLPLEARYADTWTLSGWTFTDACGFGFSAPSLEIYYDNQAYECGEPT